MVGIEWYMEQVRKQGDQLGVLAIIYARDDGALDQG